MGWGGRGFFFYFKNNFRTGRKAGNSWSISKERECGEERLFPPTPNKKKKKTVNLTGASGKSFSLRAQKHSFNVRRYSDNIPAESVVFRDLIDPFRRGFLVYGGDAAFFFFGLLLLSFSLLLWVRAAHQMPTGETGWVRDGFEWERKREMILF